MSGLDGNGEFVRSLESGEVLGKHKHGVGSAPDQLHHIVGIGGECVADRKVGSGSLNLSNWGRLSREWQIVQTINFSLLKQNTLALTGRDAEGGLRRTQCQ